MNSSPKPAFLAVVRRRSLRRLPTGRAMPKRSPAPERSGIVTTIQLSTRLVPVLSSMRDTSSVASFARSALVGRVEMPVLADRERNLAAVAARVGEDRGEQVRQIDLGVDLLHDLAVALHSHVQLIAGERGFPRHRFRRAAAATGAGGSGGWSRPPARARRGRPAPGLGRCHGREDGPNGGAGAPVVGDTGATGASGADVPPSPRPRRRVRHARPRPASRLPPSSESRRR